MHTLLPLRLFLVAGLLALFAGCGGGGSASASVTGVLVDSFGLPITAPEAVVSLDGTSTVAHPDNQGSFALTAEPGTYTLRGSYTNKTAAIRLQGTKVVTLSARQTLDVGQFPLTDPTLETGWAKYRAGQYSEAEKDFLKYLDLARSGQADSGSASAYCALGWNAGNGLNRPVKARSYFQDALAGWPENADALVGLAAATLGVMKADGPFHFNEAGQLVTSAINLPGEYSSAPVHDNINEADLRAFRTLVNYLVGNSSAARSEALSIQQLVAASGNEASEDTIAVVLAFTR